MADALMPQVVKTAVFFENVTNSMEMILAYFVIFIFWHYSEGSERPCILAMSLLAMEVLL